MHPRVRMFLEARDKARLRQDWGLVRAMTAELDRLGVLAEATLADPTGKHTKVEKRDESPEVPEEHRKGRGRPPKPRCEHGNIADRCTECEQAEIEEALAEAS